MKHFFCIDSREIYHNGVSWVDSDQTLDQSNTPAEILGSLATLPLVKGIKFSLQIGHIFKSDLGYDTAEIESISLKYTLSFKGDDVFTCTVFGTVIDNANRPVAGATIRVNSVDKFFDGVFIGPSAKTTSDAQGKYSISIPETATDGTSVDIFIEYTEKKIEDGEEFDDPIITPFLRRIIPNQASAKLSDLAILP